VRTKTAFGLRGVPGGSWEPAAPRPEAGHEIADLEQVPPPNLPLRALPWVRQEPILGGLTLGFIRRPALGWAMLWDWALITIGLAALGTLLAGG
jgi:hypothetical protein